MNESKWDICIREKLLYLKSHISVNFVNKEISFFSLTRSDDKKVKCLKLPKKDTSFFEEKNVICLRFIPARRIQSVTTIFNLGLTYNQSNHLNSIQKKMIGKVWNIHKFQITKVIFTISVFSFIYNVKLVIKSINLHIIKKKTNKCNIHL